MFFAASSHPANFIEMDLIYEAGTTITGLYGTQVSLETCSPLRLPLGAQ